VKKEIDKMLLEAEREMLKHWAACLELDVNDLPKNIWLNMNAQNIELKKMCQKRGYIFERDLEVFYEKTYDNSDGTGEPCYRLKKIVREEL